LSYRLGTTLDSYELLAVQNELDNAMTSAGLSVYKVVILLHNRDKAYTSGGLVNLGEEYKPAEQVYPDISVNSMNNYFGFEKNQFFFMYKDYFLYCDDYTYQTGSASGTICLLFDQDALIRELREILSEDCGIRFLYKGNELFTLGEAGGDLYTGTSKQMGDLSYELYVRGSSFTQGDEAFPIIIGVIIVISLFFVWLAYWVSKRYYMPINHLQQIVEKEEQGENNGKTEPLLKPAVGRQQDEMSQILSGIRTLIGEKNEYREEILTITPYVRAGILHSMISGNLTPGEHSTEEQLKVEAGQQKVHVFSEKNYVNLQKPYYILAAVNFSYEEGDESNQESHRHGLRKLLQDLVEVFSTDEVQLVYYIKDIYNVFLIMNIDNEQPMDDWFFRIHSFLENVMKQRGCQVTIGVDKIRDDIDELKKACEGALRALDGILTDGRGEVYFGEEYSDHGAEHYFPANFKEKLKKYLEKNQKDEIKVLLSEIYQKNWNIGGSPKMYHALIDELHYSISKTLKEITEYHMIHVHIEKYRDIATLQEIFDYYDAALMSIANSMSEKAQSEEQEKHLEDEISEYIDAHFCDPDLSLQSLMDRFHVSMKYLSLVCKRKYGITYLQYVQNKRIDKAAELLKTHKYSLTEVAEMCGYTSQLTFRRNFKSIRGVNPSDF
jgi:AraC-like DNA-binding protein